MEPTTAPKATGRKREYRVRTHLRSGMGTPLWGIDPENEKPNVRLAIGTDDEPMGVIAQRFAEQQGLPDRYVFQRENGEGIDPKRPLPDLEDEEVLVLVKVGK